METGIVSIETGYCFGKMDGSRFSSFEEGVIKASELGLNYLVITRERADGRLPKKIFAGWDTVKVLTLNQLIERFEDQPFVQRMLQARKSKDGLFVFNGVEGVEIEPKMVMSQVHFDKVCIMPSREGCSLEDRVAWLKKISHS